MVIEWWCDTAAVMDGNDELVESEGDRRGGGVGQIRQQNMVVDPHVNHPDRLPCRRTENRR